jgi:hypothetical protein
MAGVYTPGEPQITTFTGLEQIPLDTQLASGQIPQTGYITTGQLGLGGSLSATTQFITAAGTTQLGAAAITANKVVINVATTASTHGVRLPVAATGLSVRVANNGTFGVKVYPATGGQIAAASTNAADATVLAINKANSYVAVSTTKWVVERGA